MSAQQSSNHATSCFRQKCFDIIGHSTLVHMLRRPNLNVRELLQGFLASLTNPEASDNHRRHAADISLSAAAAILTS